MGEPGAGGVSSAKSKSATGRGLGSLSLGIALGFGLAPKAAAGGVAGAGAVGTVGTVGAMGTVGAVGAVERRSRGRGERERLLLGTTLWVPGRKVWENSIGKRKSFA